MSKLQEAKKEYNKYKSVNIVKCTSAYNYIKELEKSNAGMLDVLIRVRSELSPFIGSHTKDKPDIVDVIVNLCGRTIEKATGRKIEVKKDCDTCKYSNNDPLSNPCTECCLVGKMYKWTPKEKNHEKTNRSK